MKFAIHYAFIVIICVCMSNIIYQVSRSFYLLIFITCLAQLGLPLAYTNVESFPRT